MVKSSLDKFDEKVNQSVTKKSEYLTERRNSASFKNKVAIEKHHAIQATKLSDQ
jgi:hypothetical protein